VLRPTEDQAVRSYLEQYRESYTLRGITVGEERARRGGVPVPSQALGLVGMSEEVTMGKFAAMLSGTKVEMPTLGHSFEL
jgi:hypothetical protein